MTLEKFFSHGETVDHKRWTERNSTCWVYLDTSELKLSLSCEKKEIFSLTHWAIQGARLIIMPYVLQRHLWRLWFLGQRFRSLLVFEKAKKMCKFCLISKYPLPIRSYPCLPSHWQQDYAPSVLFVSERWHPRCDVIGRSSYDGGNSKMADYCHCRLKNKPAKVLKQKWWWLRKGNIRWEHE